MSAEHRTTKGKERIDALKEAAITMFLEDGYQAASLDALISQVGGSRRNVYDHFGGKQGLFTEAVVALCDEISAPLNDMVIDGADPEKSLRLFGRGMLDIVLAPRTLALHRMMISEGGRFPALAQSIWDAGYMNGQRVLSQWIRDGQAVGLLRADCEAERLAEDFINLTATTPQLKALVGLQPPLNEHEIEAMVDRAVTIFLNGAYQPYTTKQTGYSALHSNHTHRGSNDA
jgi:AcrR family transcriptional regulator